jgi:hypothetical protein
MRIWLNKLILMSLAALLISFIDTFDVFIEKISLFMETFFAYD